MKKITTFLVSLLVMSLSYAQEVSDWAFVPPVTDNNMSVVFPAPTLDNYIGGELMAFIGGSPVSAPSAVGSDGAGGVSVIGTDNLCGCDLADGGEELSFAILLNGEVIVITDVDPPISYTANGFEMVGGALSFSVDGAPAEFGCTDADYLEYSASANIDDGSCATLIVRGCTDSIADNYNVEANVDDGSCLYTGCMEAAADNYDPNANVEGDCLYLGCMDATACNYDSGANQDDGSCEGLLGCTDDSYYEYSDAATCDDASCLSLIVPGCNDETAFNFNPAATEDDGSCVPVLVGCTNPAADNYDSDANTNDAESCEYSGINPWGPGGGSSNNPTYVTSNNMSILFPSGNSGLWESDGIEPGDVLFAVYETARLDNDWVGYSAISGVQSAGAVTWTDSQVGIPVFGADNGDDNGYQAPEALKWLVEKNDGVVYHASLTYATPNFDGNYEDGAFITVSSITIGAPFYEGCMNPSAMNFDPLATSDDDSCSEIFSVGCLDEDKVNYAGPGANPFHDNATNFGNPFVDNETVDLLTGATSSSGTAANISDDSYCQSQLEGCTDPMAHNYDPYATQNDDTNCDWSLNGMTSYDVDADGFSLGVDFNFGAVDPNNQNDGILNSDFARAQQVFDEGALDVDDHVIDNLASLMEWVDFDEDRDERNYFVNDSTWNATYTDTLADVAAWFAQDEEDDAQELADTISDMQDRYDVNDSTWNADFNAMVASKDAAFDAMVASKDAAFAAMVEHKDSVISVTNDTLDYHRAPLVIDLHEQWNMIAYYLHHPSSVVLQFENQFGTETAIAENINIVKNNEGRFYWPEFNFDGLGQLQPGQGYQVRVKDGKSGKPDFIFEHSIQADAYKTLTPTVPQWAIDMPVEVHPNDVRTLVRVVNMLGQEVNPAEQFKGEVLLYMFNDGTVEKKMVE